MAIGTIARAWGSPSNQPLENTMKSSHLPALALAVAGAMTLLAAPAFAQSYDDKGYHDDEIIVTAPYVDREVTGRDATGARIETLTAQRAVETGDLNLRYNSDVRELHRRIADAAVNGCREVEDASTGVSLTTRSQCVRSAERSAMAQADALIDYARG
jgi:UrcA family protein